MANTGSIHTSVHTSPRDLAHLLQAILAACGGQPTILRPETVAEMLRPQVRLARHPLVAWGLGWGQRAKAFFTST